MLETQMVKIIEIWFAYKQQITLTFGILSTTWQLAEETYFKYWNHGRHGPLLYQPIVLVDTNRLADLSIWVF